MAYDITKELEQLPEKLKGKSGLEALEIERRFRLEADKKHWDESDGSEGAEVKKTIIDNNKRIEHVEGEIVSATGMKTARELNDARRASMNEPVNRLGNPHAMKANDLDFEQKSPRQMAREFFDAPEVKEFMERVAPNGSTPTRGQFGTSPAIGFKALIDGSTMVTSDRQGLVDANNFQRPLAMRDLVTILRTGNNSVDYVVQLSNTNNATPIADATSDSGSVGTKPQSTFAMESRTTPVKTIPTWMAAHRNTLSDWPQMQSIIETLLRYDVDEELNDQIAAGDGTGDNLTGVINATGTGSQAYVADPDQAGTARGMIYTARKARTKVRLEGRTQPTAYAFHPLDWEKIDLSKDLEGRYYFGGPTIIGNPRMWGLPVVEEEALTEGQGVVANWRFAWLWDRMLTQIFISDSHADFFIRNLIAILAERRAAFALIRPAAFIKIDFTP